jgi:Na+-driven multidrug efflux pump
MKDKPKDGSETQGSFLPVAAFIVIVVGAIVVSSWVAKSAGDGGKGWVLGTAAGLVCALLGGGVLRLFTRRSD